MKYELTLTKVGTEVHEWGDYLSGYYEAMDDLGTKHTIHRVVIEEDSVALSGEVNQTYLSEFYDRASDYANNSDLDSAVLVKRLK